jgi:hypothetical protein
MDDDSNEETLGKIFGRLQKYEGDEVFERFRDQEFFRYNHDQRVAILVGWDTLMAKETSPSRQTAKWMSRGRDLRAVHDLLDRAGR